MTHPRLRLAAIAAPGILAAQVLTAAAGTVFPEQAAGVWSHDGMEPFSAPTKRLACIYEPRVLFADGLIVSYAFGDDKSHELPRQDIYVRCNSNFACKVEPSKYYQDQGATGTSPDHVRFAFVGQGHDRATLCDDDGNCRVMARCGPIDWSEDETKAGLPEAWEALMKTRDE